ncbi:MAG: 50S ribosomal protein L24e [Thaumarchaeota archaeon]|nr:50S ribosomal protein L24e [Nitrososphaerota archaeon]
MLSLKNCSFCGKTVPWGEGVMMIRNDGAVHWYCSAKCRKSATIFRRDPRKFKWTRQEKAKK